MSSPQARADAVRASVSSALTCTPSTATILSDLLLPKIALRNSNDPVRAKTAKGITATARGKATKTSVKSRPKNVEKENVQEQEDEHLSLKERSILATEVINATLKSLSDAIKAPPPPLRRKESSKDAVKATSRKGLRRSVSMPQSPLQPQALNRVTSSPNIDGRAERSSISPSLIASGNRATAECARVAFACLRTLSALKGPGTELPEHQLESGMSVLIGKLILLGLEDMAIKEIRILKRLLDNEDNTTTKKGTLKTSTTAPSLNHLSDLLNFGKLSLTKSKIPLIITTQLQALRLMISSPKYVDGPAALSYLQATYHSSPTRLLLLVSKGSKPEKIARQLQTLSDHLLALTPNINPSADALALEAKLSFAPEVAIQLQALALHNRVLWWKIAGHQAHLAAGIYDPFLRSLTSFSRRYQGDALQTYHLASTAYSNLENVLSSYSENCPLKTNAFLGGIFRLLGTLASHAKLFDQAIVWASRVEGFLNPKTDSDTKRCVISAWVVGLNFRRSSSIGGDEVQLSNLLESLDRPFKGESSEIEDLLMEVSSLRRVMIGELVNKRSSVSGLTTGMRELCEKLIFKCPRLCLRYLGTLTSAETAMKDILRYEQRRQFIRKQAANAIDSALFLMRSLMAEGRLIWEAIDSILQECLVLAERIEPIDAEDGPISNTSLPVKISNLYFSQHLNLRRDADNPKDVGILKSLKRSIDCVRTRPVYERKLSQFTVKLEKLAELYRKNGLYKELFSTLISLRDEAISGGALRKVANAASSTSISQAWSQGEETALLARTIQSLTKIQLRHPSVSREELHIDDAWTAEEKGVVLEHIVGVLSAQTHLVPASIKFQTNIIDAALELYTTESYPIRQLRILRTALFLDAAHRNILTERIDELATSPVTQCIEGTEDFGLEHYLAHSQTILRSLSEMQRNTPNIDTIKNCIALWSSIQSRCKDMTALEHDIDDVPQLLIHLQSLGDYMQMKGHYTIRIAILRLIAAINEFQDSSSDPNALTLSYSSLGSQWLELGYSGKAGLSFDKAESYSHQNGVSSQTTLQLYLAYSEYLLVIGNYTKSEEYLLRAQVCYDKGADFTISMPTSLHQKTMQHQIIAKAYLLYSKLAMERGAAHIALTYAKLGVRLLRYAWARIEHSVKVEVQEEACQLEAERLIVDASSLNISTNEFPTDAMTEDRLALGASFWPLIGPLFQGLSYLSELYAHNGMFSETMYYAEQAETIVSQVRSGTCLAMASAMLGNWWLKAGNLENGSKYLIDAKFMESQQTRQGVLVSYYMSKMHNLLGDHDASSVALESAATTMKILMSLTFINQLDRPSPALSEIITASQVPESLEDGIAKLTITKRKVIVTRKTTVREKGPVKKHFAAPAKVQLAPTASVAQECRQLTLLEGSILRVKAHTLMMGKNFRDAKDMLQDIAGHSTSQIDFIEHGLLMAKHLILQSMEQIDADPVYSTLQESTISYPSVSVSKSTGHGERLSVTRVSPANVPQTGRGGRVLARTKSPAPNSFFDNLRQAQEQLSEVLSMASIAAPVHVIHTISALSNSVAILLSAAGQVNGKSLAHPGYASCLIESARNLAFRRERRALAADARTTTSVDDCGWPSAGFPDSKRLSLGAKDDMSRFQKDYIDIIPNNWTAVSISLSDSRNELSITRFQAGQSPFVLRLPLGRNNSIDADEEVFGFEQGRAELREILELANESSHSARDMNTSECKEDWWEEREALDSRLRDLLENIEKVWLGGFSGIFSQRVRRTDLLARFQKSFTNILDKHLPSRQKNGKRSISPRVTLDSRILELFIGLGDASAEECDFSEPLNDLLYFVVDVLQFHGELNAYAEIDFDSIVIETHDALVAYHEAAKHSSKSEENRHMILILDKALHAFPWESLPCMTGHAVSRINSLSCLRNRILAQQPEIPEHAPAGHYITRSKISYMLNPSSDLHSTQSKFSKPLSSLPPFTSITNRSPTEAEFTTALSSSELFLYFGHGSGAQYIRSKEIRKLESCATSILMGCSSGKMTEVGEFESFGTPTQYLQAGAPALVGLLWDVTDKDVDRFAERMFEAWDLYGKSVGTSKGGRAKSKKGANGSQSESDDGRESENKTSLVEALARGRGACKFRYLTAASVVVYGVPVYLR
ncbi:peptidase family C50-domain-containing protein [Calycina marina]|uniref:separase n=1 Tax=Calycina marina TaxID=1763456 RepID=A0A9P7Z8L7_9HELO|nr:peptidase family C50-domain-containing protein [Calycina marina]